MILRIHGKIVVVLATTTSHLSRFTKHDIEALHNMHQPPLTMIWDWDYSPDDLDRVQSYNLWTQARPREAPDSEANHHDELAELRQLADLALDLDDLYLPEVAIDQFSLRIQRCNAHFEEAQTSASSLHAVLQDHIRDTLLQAPIHVRQTVAFWAYTQGHPALFGFLLRIKQVASSRKTQHEHTLLSLAIERGDKAVVEEVLQHQPDIDAKFTLEDQKEWTGLKFAAAGGHLGMVELFLDRNAGVHAVTGNRSRTALHSAAEAGHPAVVDRLLLANADPNAADQSGNTALSRAAAGGHLAVIDRLLLANADIGAANRWGHTALEDAADYGHLAVVDRLLLVGADLDVAHQQQDTALGVAAAMGHLAVVDRLLLAGANINARAYRPGLTVLSEAAINGHLAVVERLLLAGADVNPADLRVGSTTLDYAVGSRHPDVVDRLLLAGADIETADQWGNTALHRAAARGHLAIPDHLLLAGADVDKVDCRDMAPLRAAVEGGHLSVVERIQMEIDIRRGSSTHP